MPDAFKGHIALDVRDSTPDWSPYTPPTAREDAPNVLIVLYDDNEISIEDDTRIAKNEDVGARYAAYGWHVQQVDWRSGDPSEGEYHVPARCRAVSRPTFLAWAVKVEPMSWLRVFAASSIA